MTDHEDIEEIKQEKAAKIIYIALTAVIVLTMIISVVSAVNRRNRAKTPPADVTVTDGTTASDQGVIPQITAPADTIRPQQKPQETKPAQTESEITEPAQSAAEPQEQDEPASAERIFVVPVNGSVIKDSVDFCSYILKSVYVAIVPGKAFESPEEVRISYSNSMENIQEAVARLKKALADLK